VNARDISEQLSLREFLVICTYFDLRKKERESRPRQMWFRHGNGSDMQTIRPRVPQAQFDIVEIRRTPEKLMVLCEDDRGEQIFLDCTSNRTDKAKPARSYPLQVVA